MCRSTAMSENSRQKNLKLMEYPRSILSAEGSRAKMLAQQVKELVSLIVKGTLPAPVFGESMPGLFASLSQDGSWLKTWQGYCQSLLPGFGGEDSELYSETWPKWGIVLDGHAMELPMLERHIKDKECSLWTTVTTDTSDRKKKYLQGGTPLTLAVKKNWPTPRAGDSLKRGRVSNDQRNGLPAAVLWHTPDCSDRRSAKSKQQGLSNQVKAWTTPKAHMHGDCASERRRKSPNLESVVKMYPTPTRSDVYKWSYNTNKQSGRCLEAMARTGKLNEQKGQLNADWVELLMGLPIGWTDVDVANEDIESWTGWPAAINVEQYAYEPPRVIVGQKNRAKRLKALGNGCVPQQIYLVFAAIREMNK